MYQTDQNRAPLFEGLQKHQSKETLPFHIPGHKRGKGMDPEFRNFIGKNALDIDLINIAPLDDLHHPHGIIQEAQELAAEAFGADATFFSVQGTSGAIMTMIMTVCTPGDKIIVPRNVHKSIMSAIIFSGATPIFIHPEVDSKLGISHGISLSAVNRALDTHPDAKGLLVINPTYFGVSADLRSIVNAAHLKEIPVLVDEAHGVHIHFHEDLPLSAMQAGADMAATSVHKLGGSLTQSSVLNIQGALVSRARVQTVISMLTTTSTSYILLASLDTARRYLASEGHSELTRIQALAADARSKINRIPGLYAPGREIINELSRYDLDPTKLTVSVRDLHISGYDAEVWLRDYKNIEVELSDLYNILLLITFGDDENTIIELINALQDLSSSFNSRKKSDKLDLDADIPNIPTLAYSPRDAFYADTENIPLAASAGRISAEFIMIYPPGIPVFIPGEIIEQENLDYIQKNIEIGLPVQGPEDTSLLNLKVIKERKAIF